MKSKYVYTFCAKFVDKTLRTKHKGAVFATENVVWDYGFHYPLLIDLGGGLRAVNDRGYSVTTGRHISQARHFAQVSVKIPQDNECDTHASNGDGTYRYLLISEFDSPETLRKKVIYFLKKEQKEITITLRKLRKNAFVKREKLSTRIKIIKRGLNYCRNYYK